MRWTRIGLVALVVGILSASQSSACTPDYTVAKGDTLSKIARAHLGSIFAFQSLHEANRDVIGKNPNLIFVGQQLSIPCSGVELGEIDWSVMPNPDTLAHLLNQSDIQILDIRSPKKVAIGVIPGSISIPFSQWRGPKQNKGKPPSPEKIAELIGNAGLHLDRPIVVVHSHEHPMQTGAAAVVYWNLKSSGAQQIAILRGGFKGWETANLPVAAKPAQPTAYDAKVYSYWNWRADEVTIYGIATGQIPGHLLDARPHGMFEKFDKVGRALATTLPTARNLPAPPLLSALRGEIDVIDGVETVIEAFQSLDADGTRGEVVTFCHVGELAALNWFYASELAGLPNIKLYPESLKGWTQAGGNLFEATH